MNSSVMEGWERAVPPSRGRIIHALAHACVGRPTSHRTPGTRAGWRPQSQYLTPTPLCPLIGEIRSRNNFIICWWTEGDIYLTEVGEKTWKVNPLQVDCDGMESYQFSRHARKGTAIVTNKEQPNLER